MKTTETNIFNEKDEELTLASVPAPDTEEGEKRKKKPFRIGEVSALETKSRRVYRMSDGTYEAVYTAPTSQSELDELDEAPTLDADGKHYRKRHPHFTACFSRDAENDELFSMEQGEYRVCVFAKKKKRTNAHGTLPTLRESTLVFKGVKEGTDYEYTVLDDGVKENIIVKKPALGYTYAFLLRCEGLRARLSEDAARVSFVDENETEIFYIPAPFMTDAAGVRSYLLSYALKEEADGSYTFTVTADKEWMNAEGRVFPVTVDPQIILSGTGKIYTYSWLGGNIASQQNLHTVGKTSSGVGRMYLRFAMPSLPRNPRIKKAELVLRQSDETHTTATPPLFGLYHVTSDITVGTCTPTHSDALIDYAPFLPMPDEEEPAPSYRFDVTSLFDQIAKGEESYKSFVLKLIDESLSGTNKIDLGGTAGGSAPELIVTYESSYAIGSAYRAHTHALGRFGQASVDLACGNLMLECEDFAWAGNRMPVTVKHLYNSALAGYAYTNNSAIGLPTAYFSPMQIGYGFRLNLMQSMVASSFVHDGTSYLGYVYLDENGNASYFKESEKTVEACDSGSQCYNLYEDVESGALYDPVERTLTQGEDIYLFDEEGRLVKITSGKNAMQIFYDADKISGVTDGAGREFTFEYLPNGELYSITAPDGSCIEYGYESSLLTYVSYPDGRTVNITYTGSKPASITLRGTNGAQVYRVAYTFSGDRIAGVTEYSADNIIGTSSTYTYSIAAGRTVVTSTEQADGSEPANAITTTYTFDDDGNVVSEYLYSTDTDSVGVNGESADGVHPYMGEGGANTFPSSINLLSDHAFEARTSWTDMPNNTATSAYADCRADNEESIKFGKNALFLSTGSGNASGAGVYQTVSGLSAGEYTFSAYLRAATDFTGTNAGAFLRVTDASGNVLGRSECVSIMERDYTRIAVSFTLTAPQSVKVQILANGNGRAFADGAQLEKNPYASAYNMLENADFENGLSGWSSTSNVYSNTSAHFHGSKSVSVTGSLNSERYALQTVAVHTAASTRETFRLSGWAKGNSLPTHERTGRKAPAFRLRARIAYADGTAEDFFAPFSPSAEEWQFASVEFSKSKYKEVASVAACCDYSYNVGTAYFDNIQLVRCAIEKDLSKDDFPEEASDTATAASASTATKTEADTAPAFKEAEDEFGNALTETTFKDGEFGTIYRAFGYTANGNDLLSETDARGNETSYDADPVTSRNKEVTDRLGNKTAYEYDSAGRTKKVTSKNASGTTLAHVSYAYDAFDNMTLIARGDGMKYALAYNAFHNLESIGIKTDTEEKPEKLIRYTYKSGNGRLKEMEYANGDRMKATYNATGQMVGERWLDKNGVEIARYKYAYNDAGNIVRSIDFILKKEYNYMYEDGKLVRATEADITLSGDIVTAKTVVNTIRYCYDSEGNLARKVIAPAGAVSQTVFYETSDDTNTVVKFQLPLAENTAIKPCVTAHSKNDSFGRKEFDELQLGKTFLYRKFAYHDGILSDTHVEKDKVKSTPTTQLVSKISFSDGRTIEYEYDKEERITKVIDSVDGTTEYTYDALGQLLTETNGTGVVNTMTYDNYGNIKTKNGVAYTYGNSVWKDLLTKVGSATISYDAQGNPTSYLGHTLTWEKGRQLKSYDSNTYTYNANGIRTSKTVGGVKHTYTLDGTKILRETWGSNTLIPLYDNEENVCGISYNYTPYYFIKNQQGDVIAIADQNANVVARYSYDAWGKVLSVTDGAGNSVANIASHIANINPYRYRSYYYDAEIAKYYLQSRYYDAAVGRFINVDTTDSLQNANLIFESNLFSYCQNNPVNESDYTGCLFTALIKPIIAGLFKGFIGLLGSDLISFLFKVLFVDHNAKFEMSSLTEYLNEMATAAIIELLKPFRGAIFQLQVFMLVAPKLTRMLNGDMSAKEWAVLLVKLVVLVVKNLILDKSTTKFNKQREQELKKLKKYKKKKNSRNIEYKNEKREINLKFDKKGFKVELKLDISEYFLGTFLEALLSV